jgi:DNA-binding NtrC family response regulator
MSAKRVLIVPARWALAERLRAEGHLVVEADTVEDAGERVDAGVDAVFIDLRALVPLDIEAVEKSVEKTGKCMVLHEATRTSGFGAELAALKAVRERDPDPPVVVFAQPDEVDGLAVSAMAAGAFDYALEPINIDVIARRVRSMFEVTRLRRELRTLRDRLARPFTLSSLVGVSPAMQFARDLARRVSFADAPVLLTGGRGTGKDHSARVIHNTGTRAMGPFL